MNDRQLSEQEIKMRKHWQEELWVATHSNESIIRQKARTRWIKDGDCNSWFFHLIVNRKQRFNMIRGVFADGCWIKEPCRVKEEIRQFFKRRVKVLEKERPRLDRVKF